MFSSIPALPQQRATTGSIEGVVVRKGTEQPIANAQVTLTQVTSPPGNSAARPASVTSGLDGTFVFSDLMPGTYRIAAITDSLNRVANGQQIPDDLGRLLFVEAGRTVTGAIIRIPTAGAITGRIFDENGQPATGAPVQLMRAIYQYPQGKVFQGAGIATADDRGVYRLFAVPPGRYYLMAGTAPSPLNPAPLQGAAARPPRFSVKYFPDVEELDQAMSFEVKSGDDTSIDMRLNRLTGTFHIRGHVVDPAGGPFPQGMRARLGTRVLGGFVSANRADSSFDPATGAFDIPNVPPGEFFAIAVDSSPPNARELELAASVPVQVTNADIDGLVLTLAQGLTVNGKLAVEGQSISSIANLNSLRLGLQLKLNGLGLPRSSEIDADGSFQIAGLRDGEYRPTMNVTSPGIYVQSIKYDRKEIQGATFKFDSANPATFEVVLKSGGPIVSGKVSDAQSRPASGVAVFMLPADRERLDLFRRTDTDQSGNFTFNINLLPGEYKIFSWEDVDNNAVRDPDFLKQYEPFGKEVIVREFSNSNVDVKVIPEQ